jgi:NAD(P)-dependent dehydrogenase (short-subunit alcohol dehydrogenase family)
MSELRFDGRVAIVTGAGGQDPSLGRSHAALLAERGAKVVVNDLGVGPDGRGIMRANAEQVVEEILAAGGEAVPDQHSVADEEGARRVVATALDTWGQLDIVINNAGVCFMAHFDEISSADIRKIIDVHLMGTVWMCRAAWAHMREAGYGRIVNTTSGAMFGIENLSIYGAAKSGIFGLTRGLAVEGAEVGIKVNALGPAANTTAIRHFNETSPFTELMEAHFPTSLVSPAVAYLAHEACELSGASLEAAAGNVGLRVFGQTAGYTDTGLTAEKVRHNLATIIDKRTATMIPDPGEVPAGPTGAAQIGAVLKPYQPI